MTTARERAGLPSNPELRGVTLEVMRSMSLPATNDQINLAVADALGLTSEQRSSPHTNSNQTELAYRVAWARTALRYSGAAERVGRALWELTEEGMSITVETINQRYEAHIAKLKAVRAEHSPEPQDPEPNGDEPERLDWRDDLLVRLKVMSPTGFEHLAAALLRAAGFDDVDVTGQTSDGGIDGIGIYRPSGLISFHTAFQCKRYQGSVGASVVRDFRGSFIGRADRGIIVTTGYFTNEAKSEANRAGANPVDLIDGEALCDLLREHKLGVRTTTRVVEDITVDETYFGQFEGSS